jgi:hypothetical protein
MNSIFHKKVDGFMIIMISLCIPKPLKNMMST